jgi:hypothetical protein
MLLRGPKGRCGLNPAMGAVDQAARCASSARIV